MSRTRTHEGRSLSRPYTPTSNSKQNPTNNRVPKRLKPSQSSLTNVRLRSQSRGSEGQPSVKVAPDFKESNVVVCRDVPIKKETDSLRNFTSLKSTSHIAKENNHHLLRRSTDLQTDQNCTYKIRKSMRTLKKKQEPDGITVDPSTLRKQTPALDSTVIKTESEDLEEYLSHGLSFNKTDLQNKYIRTSNLQRFSQPHLNSVIKSEDSCKDPFVPTFLPVMQSANIKDMLKGYPALANGRRSRKKKSKESSRGSGKRKKKHRVPHYDSLILENTTGIPKLTLRRRRDSSCSEPRETHTNFSKFSKNRDKKGRSNKRQHTNSTKLKVQVKHECPLSQSCLSGAMLSGVDPLELLSSQAQNGTKHGHVDGQSSSEDGGEGEDDFIPLPPAKRLRLIFGKDSIDIDISSRRREDQSPRLISSQGQKTQM